MLGTLDQMEKHANLAKQESTSLVPVPELARCARLIERRQQAVTQRVIVCAMWGLSYGLAIVWRVHLARTMMYLALVQLMNVPLVLQTIPRRQAVILQMIVTARLV